MKYSILILSIISLSFIVSCNRTDGVDPAPGQNGTGKLKYIAAEPANGGIRFEYDDQQRVSLIIVGTLSNIDSFYVYYSAGNIANRLMLRYHGTLKSKTPIFLLRNGSGNVTSVVFKYAVDSTDSFGNPNSLYQDENNAYYTTYTAGVDPVSRLINFEYNSKNRFTKFKLSNTTTEITYAPGDTIPNGAKHYFIDGTGATIVDANITYDTVSVSNINPAYELMKQVPIINIYGRSFLPRTGYAEDVASSFLYYAPYLPDAVSYRRVSGLQVNEHYKYDFNTQGKMSAITNRAIGAALIYPFTYY